MSMRYLPALVTAALVGVMLALGVSVVFTAPDTALPWSVFGGGAGGASSTNYSLGATSGQPAIGQSDSTGFRLGAGFWYGACADPDADGATSCPPVDNCPSTANLGQQNNVHPGTPAGDACEDPEPDGVFDITDNCPDTANAGQENADGDQWGDACETAGCIAVYTLWLTPAGDGDCDGFPSTVGAGGRGPEAFIGTDPADPCPDDATDDAWPMDFDMNTTVNIIDVLFFATPILPGGYDSRFDLNANGVVNIIDVLMFGPFIGRSCTNP